MSVASVLCVLFSLLLLAAACAPTDGVLMSNVMRNEAVLRRALNPRQVLNSLEQSQVALEDVKRVYQFPQNFVFSAATSAYQIEGAAREGGSPPV